MMRADVGPLSFAVRSEKTTILVVDDSPDIRRYLTLALELDHYKVETASSGEEASQRFHEGCSAAVVLLDLQMPGMDGLETLRNLRQRRPELKVIMCSAVDDPDIMQEAARLGAEAYLVKPIEHLYLSAAVERCLQASANPADLGLSADVLAMASPGSRPN
jgi:CheY-like chemotaxis protein